ncbi:hypothetical protein DL98DRAFT_597334 [Cadophora sp. DSE1049]|nr:hypothetical protein DL98DRAFT_597334 [Cadophora sp. DSE1049]
MLVAAVVQHLSRLESATLPSPTTEDAREARMQSQVSTLAASAPLFMSQTKEKLLKYLDLPPDTYALMAKETDRVYSWLISEKSHLRDNGKRTPPHAWSDFKEQWKDDAMKRIARGGDQYTSYYWNLASQQDGCPNLVARWFLYHKFRCRDGRNRTHQKPHDKHGGSSKTKYKSTGHEDPDHYDDNPEGSVNAGPSTHRYISPGTNASTGYYGSGPCQYYDSASQNPDTNESARTYYDPVRDV